MKVKQRKSKTDIGKLKNIAARHTIQKELKNGIRKIKESQMEINSQ